MAITHTALALLLDLYIFIHCIKPLDGNFHHCSVRESRRRSEGRTLMFAHFGGLEIRYIGRYEEYKAKQFEISILIMSCLFSLESRVTFHSKKSRRPLWKQRNQSVKCSAARVEYCTQADYSKPYSKNYPLHLLHCSNKQFVHSEQTQLVLETKAKSYKRSWRPVLTRSSRKSLLTLE